MNRLWACALVFVLGIFVFSRATLAQPANDTLANAIALFGDPINTTGTTVGATPDDGDAGTSFCGTPITTGGVWYEVAGTGGLITADTCSGGTNYDTKLSVFSGSPGSLVCIAGNDDDFNAPCGNFQSRVSWSSNANEPYYLLVHGFSGDRGAFDLNIAGAAIEPVSGEGLRDGPVGVPTLPPWLLIALGAALAGFGSRRLFQRGG
ncbi:MAG: hypothetical protein AAGI11_04805 [Pseudomonadota bacterium]